MSGHNPRGIIYGFEGRRLHGIEKSWKVKPIRRSAAEPEMNAIFPSRPTKGNATRKPCGSDILVGDISRKCCGIALKKLVCTFIGCPTGLKEVNCDLLTIQRYWHDPWCFTSGCKWWSFATPAAGIHYTGIPVKPKHNLQQKTGQHNRQHMSMDQHL